MSTRWINNTFSRFILVGIINTLAGVGIMFGLYNVIKLGYWVSSAITYFIGIFLSLFLNKYFTFRIKGWSIEIIVAFILTIGFSYLIAYGIAKPLLNHFMKRYDQAMRENGALLLGMCLFSVLNYCGQRYIVFNKKTIYSNEK